ncbi:Alpha/Beta hydrolase protein [Cercophora scortea]|uniref:Alpha/Beta hydrolase protein n=1 Tax=Cercophora scortea TaxID=314031 RepID=A0AAE0M3M2_9PEZI|nr:Alpha/Beta hydrolase protein [Cercophora scortea]
MMLRDHPTELPPHSRAIRRPRNPVDMRSLLPLNFGLGWLDPGRTPRRQTGKPSRLTNTMHGMQNRAFWSFFSRDHPLTLKDSESDYQRPSSIKRIYTCPLNISSPDLQQTTPPLPSSTPSLIPRQPPTMDSEFTPTRATVHNEGCDLHYWSLGTGPLILFIPGGNGHGRQFNNIITALAPNFTCATFDRRQMSASQVPVNKKLSPPQQARDIRAIILALGFDKAILFGSSSGGIFAFQFAHDFPEMVDHIISHEAAIISLLPDATELWEWFLHLLEVFETQGLETAAAEFGAKLTGYDDEGIPKTVPPPKENPMNFWENEFPTLLGYTPNLGRLRENRVSVGVMRGVRCKDAFFARAVEEQARVLGCPRMVVAGHHQGFEVETEEFLGGFREMLDFLEKKRRTSVY